MRVLIFALMIGCYSVAFASESAGIFKNISADVVVIHADKSKATPKTGDKFFESDTMKTGWGGCVGLIFSDNTLVSVGRNSEYSYKIIYCVVCSVCFIWMCR